MYLFDTDTISNLLRKGPFPGLLRKLAGLPAEQQFISTITVGELIYGAYRSTRPDYFLEKLDQLVWPNVQILSFDEAAAHTYGRLRAQLEREGILVSEPDLRIATISLSRQLTLVTGNIRHFSRIPDLRIENWLQ
jgi:predicted nucleic acid-binding protein